MRYFCPRHQAEMEENHLDCYYCPKCDYDWLIHPYRSDRRGIKKPKSKPRAKSKGTKAICKACGKEMMRNQVVRHNRKEHPEAIKANKERYAKYGGLGLEGHLWFHLADTLPGDLI